MTRKPDKIPPAIKRGIMTMLEDFLVVDGKFCKYKNSMTDERIATRYSVSIWSVQNMRRQFFGSLEGDQISNGNSPMANAFARITELENALTFLAQRVAELENTRGQP